MMRLGNSIGHVPVTLLFMGLTSAPSSWAFRDVYRVCWEDTLRHEGGKTCRLLCLSHAVFSTYDVFVELNEYPNISQNYFLSSAFSKLCFWFILSGIKKSVKRSMSGSVSFVPTDLSLRHKILWNWVLKCTNSTSW